MAIWALKGPTTADYGPEEYHQVVNFLTNSFRTGVARFGWGYIDKADLHKLEPKPFTEMDEHEMQCWNKANFLLDIQPGDWVVQINLPYWGACLTAQVVASYSFEQEDNEVSDYRHMLVIDTSTIVEFERNDYEVLPIISSRLKLQGRKWRICHEQEFFQTIENIKSGDIEKKEDESVGIFYLKRDLSPLLSAVTEKIYKTHPNYHLEGLIAEVFRRIPTVTNVREHGKHKGWGTDNGADLIVTYKSGLAISNLEKEETLVVQVKSYGGKHWEVNAVDQIGDAIKEFNANAGMLITTGESTENLEKAIEELSNRLSKSPEEGGLGKDIPISLIAGQDVAKFVLRHGKELIL
ncbi:restriction endonuclease [Chitinophaga sp. S165]|uniref:restriction endonuclease n=1 Tax=Chitinophaga sp. S165 TaxID=2135462 RepID=UPI000D7096B7|nr:restriction endonuclease [Chitinophaga sp. S165]PWV44634.1 restriction endonuclease [Chitinophaga sp. S165]